MEWLKPLYGKVIGLDTAPLIYFIEKHPTFHPLVKPFFEAMQHGEFEAVTSTLTVTEVMVHPLRNNDSVLAATYRDILLHAAHLQTVPVSVDIAENAAHLRAQHNLRTPDAIQAATARVMKADYFLTNDTRLAIVSNPAVVVLESLMH